MLDLLASGTALLVALGLSASGCSLDDAGPATGPLTRIVFHYDSPATLSTDEQRDLLVDRVTGRLAQIGVDTQDESFLVQAGEGSVAISCRGCEDLVPEIRTVVPRQGQLRIRPVLATEPGVHAPTVAGLTSADDDRADAVVILPKADGGTTFQLGPTSTDGRTVAVAGTDVLDGRWQVRVRLSDDAQASFDELVAACNAQDATCPTGHLAFVVDGAVLASPRITQPAIAPDEVLLTNEQMDETSARELANVLQQGPLPVRLQPAIVTTELTSTTGAD